MSRWRSRMYSDSAMLAALSSLLILVQDRQRLVGGHGRAAGGALMIVNAVGVLHLEHGRVIAARQAHHRLHRPLAILGHLAHLHTQLLADLASEGLGAAQGAGQVGANL